MLHYNQDKTMKSKKLLIALAGCAAFVATACHGDLDIIQDNQLTASNMWTESSDVTTSAYGIYYLMRANFVQDKVNVFYWGEARVLRITRLQSQEKPELLFVMNISRERET